EGRIDPVPTSSQPRPCRNHDPPEGWVVVPVGVVSQRVPEINRPCLSDVGAFVVVDASGVTAHVPKVQAADHEQQAKDDVHALGVPLIPVPEPPPPLYVADGNGLGLR